MTHVVPYNPNQCDGCRAGMLLAGGLHYYNGYAYMTCTADQYPIKAAAPKVDGDLERESFINKRIIEQ